MKTTHGALNIPSFQFPTTQSSQLDLSLSRRHCGHQRQLLYDWFRQQLIKWWHLCVSWVTLCGTNRKSIITSFLISQTARIHDDVIKWKHFLRYWIFVREIHRSQVNSPHKGQWRKALMFSLICVPINGWANSREAGDLRCYRTHYDVTVMLVHWWKTECISLMLICGASITNIFHMRQHHGQVNRYPLLILDVISHPWLIARSV